MASMKSDGRFYRSVAVFEWTPDRWKAFTRYPDLLGRITEALARVHFKRPGTGCEAIQVGAVRLGYVTQNSLEQHERDTLVMLVDLVIATFEQERRANDGDYAEIFRLRNEP